MIAFLKARALRLWTAETAAMVLYNLVTGIPNIFLETALVGNTFDRYVFIHWCMFNPAKFGLARFLQAPLADGLRRRYAPIDDGRWRRKSVDAFALACYQIPIYLLASYVGGRTPRELLWLLCLSVIEHAIAGPWHGKVRDWAKKFFATRSAVAPIALEPAVGE